MISLIYLNCCRHVSPIHENNEYTAYCADTTLDRKCWKGCFYFLHLIWFINNHIFIINWRNSTNTKKPEWVIWSYHNLIKFRPTCEQIFQLGHMTEMQTRKHFSLPLFSSFLNAWHASRHVCLTTITERLLHFKFNTHFLVFIMQIEKLIRELSVDSSNETTAFKIKAFSQPFSILNLNLVYIQT